MRYFVGKDVGAIIREKQIFSGDDTKADGLVSAFLSAHPGWTVQEVDQPTFDATAVVLDNGPTRNEALTILAAGITGDAKLMRAILLVILDEINTIRTLPALNQTPRTITQMRTAIQSKINSGASD